MTAFIFLPTAAALVESNITNISCCHVSVIKRLYSGAKFEKRCVYFHF
ncbi:hypothetical protein imdm_877 [gamma proteobacterium IMCC2047]|nr:hypothetical protein imdm_877 [gamma proteobacterium IMCC2047]